MFGILVFIISISSLFLTEYIINTRKKHKKGDSHIIEMKFLITLQKLNVPTKKLQQQSVNVMVKALSFELRRRYGFKH